MNLFVTLFLYIQLACKYLFQNSVLNLYVLISYINNNISLHLFLGIDESISYGIGRGRPIANRQSQKYAQF